MKYRYDLFIDMSDGTREQFARVTSDHPPESLDAREQFARRAMTGFRARAAIWGVTDATMIGGQFDGRKLTFKLLQDDSAYDLVGAMLPGRGSPRPPVQITPTMGADCARSTPRHPNKSDCD